MSKLKLNLDYTLYFGIFIVKKDQDDTAKSKFNIFLKNSQSVLKFISSFMFIAIRRLQEFESPYISLKAANKVETHKLLLRKS